MSSFAVVLSQHFPNSGQRFTSSHEVVQAIVVAVGSRVSRKIVHSVCRGPAYQDSGESHR